MTNKTYNRLKERLKITEKWIEHFLDVEKHRSISKKARKVLNKDRPFLGFIFNVNLECDVFRATPVFNCKLFCS